MPAFKNLTDRKFNRLTVIRDCEKTGYWLCQCECGNIKEIRGSHLSAGLIQSCGCFRNEQSSVRTHILHKANTKTGLSGSPTYNTWCGMKSRCSNPNTKHFAEYGGRGIKVCDRWLESFENFLADMGECPKGLTIERINNNGSYEKSNCRWATRKEQQNNTRQNQNITYYGMTKTATEWGEFLGIKAKIIHARLSYGWPINKVLAKTKQYDKEGLKLGGDANGARQRAKTHCKNGHPFDEANTAWYKGTRSCRRCHANRQAGRMAKIPK